MILDLIVTISIKVTVLPCKIIVYFEGNSKNLKLMIKFFKAYTKKMLEKLIYLLVNSKQTPNQNKVRVSVYLSNPKIT